MCLSQFPYLRFKNSLMHNAVIITTGSPNKIIGEKDLGVFHAHKCLQSICLTLSYNFQHLTGRWLAWLVGSMLSHVMVAGQNSEGTTRCLQGPLRPRLGTSTTFCWPKQVTRRAQIKGKGNNFYLPMKGKVWGWGALQSHCCKDTWIGGGEAICRQTTSINKVGKPIQLPTT